MNLPEGLYDLCHECRALPLANAKETPTEPVGELYSKAPRGIGQ